MTPAPRHGNMAPMCGRYTLTAPIDSMRALFGFDSSPNLAARYNIAPGQDVPAVRLAGDGTRNLVLVRWGLVPSWARDPAIGNRMINARAETVAEKPSFRSAFRRRRCLIPADGFYEWQVVGKGPKQPPKQPWYIRLEGGAPFAFAGLWEHWQGADGSALETCAIVTTDANAVLAPIHHRMPVILPPDAIAAWLDGPPEAAAPLMAPYRGRMEAWPVATRVNKVENDGPALVEPVAPPAAAAPPTGEAAPPRPAPGQLDLF